MTSKFAARYSRELWLEVEADNMVEAIWQCDFIMPILNSSFAKEVELTPRGGRDAESHGTTGLALTPVS
jgi:hypothetical protein